MNTITASANSQAQTRQTIDPKTLETAKKFEAAFLTPMLDEMMRTAGPATFGAGQAEDVWRSFLAGAVAEQIAEGCSTGIAQTLAQQMKAYGG